MMCQCAVITVPLGSLAHPSKPSWWVTYLGQSLFLTLAAESRERPSLPGASAAAAQLLKLMRNLKAKEKIMEGLEVVDTDKPAGCFREIGAVSISKLKSVRFEVP